MNSLLSGYKTLMAQSSALAPLAIERVMRVKGDVRLGVPVVLTTKGQSALVVAIEMLTPDRFDALTAAGRRADIALTRHRMAGLGLADLPAAEVWGMALPVDATLHWVNALADPAISVVATVTDRKGAPLTAPFAGDTICKAAIALAKSAQLLPAALVVPLDGNLTEALQHGLCMIDAGEVLAELAAERFQHHVSTARLPMAHHHSGRVHVFRPDDGSVEHYAIEIGAPDLTRPVLVRLHSACFTGDVMGSLKCDCGAQLNAACAAMAEAGGGVLLYLNQEGRGIGMANKMRAYALQDTGFDTVEANNHLGFDDDERDFRNGSALLRQLGIATVRLMTNNPAKVAILQAQGITVTERVPLQVGKTTVNARYLATKAAKSGHVLA